MLLSGWLRLLLMTISFCRRAARKASHAQTVRVQRPKKTAATESGEKSKGQEVVRDLLEHFHCFLVLLRTRLY